MLTDQEGDKEEKEGQGHDFFLHLSIICGQHYFILIDQSCRYRSLLIQYTVAESNGNSLYYEFKYACRTDSFLSSLIHLDSYQIFYLHIESDIEPTLYAQ